MGCLDQFEIEESVAAGIGLPAAPREIGRGLELGLLDQAFVILEIRTQIHEPAPFKGRFADRELSFFLRMVFSLMLNNLWPVRPNPYGIGGGSLREGL